MNARYPYRILVLVGDAEREAAQQLLATELGGEGEGWFSIELRGVLGAKSWLSSSLLTARNLATLNWYQTSPDNPRGPLQTIRYVVSDSTGKVVQTSAPTLASLLGIPLSLDGLLSLLGLTRPTPPPLA